MYRHTAPVSTRRWTWLIKNWPSFMRALPAVVTKAGRARFAWMLGWELGRLRGSLRYRVFAL